jgi:hypothetical protein
MCECCDSGAARSPTGRGSVCALNAGKCVQGFMERALGQPERLGHLMDEHFFCRVSRLMLGKEAFKERSRKAAGSSQGIIRVPEASPSLF